MRKGFTLLETVFALVIFSLVISMTMGTWLLFMYKSNRVNNQAMLDMDVRKVIERFRAEMRNTARESIVFYPGTEPYQAVGFALPDDQDGDGLMDMDAGTSNILWRQTIVYHVWNYSPYQMRRTVFSNRNNDASYQDRYNQIESVVKTGNGSAGCLAGETASTSVMFENLFTGRLWHAEARYDCYAAQANTREKINFGSLPLGAGEHTVNFTIVDQNPSSSGMKLRLDQVFASVSAWPRECEWCTASGVSGSTEFIGQGMAGAGYGVTAATAASGDTFSLKVYNDAIEECVFIGEGRNVSFSNTVVRFDTDYTPSALSAGAYVAKLDGQFKMTWWGSVQSAQQDVDTVGREVASSDVLYYPLTNSAVRIPLRGEYVRADGYGPVFHMYKSYYNNHLKILNPAYAVTETPDSPNIADTNLVRVSFYQNGVLKASWADCAAGPVELRPDNLEPIYEGESFIFSYQLTILSAHDDAIRAFRITDGAPVCWMVEGGDAATAMQGVWSDYKVLIDKGWTGAWKPCMPGLVCMTANYADEGEYVSHVYDTQDADGKSKTFEWTAEVPSAAGLKLYVRSGNTLSSDGFSIEDAPAWENVAEASNGGTFSGSTGRYVQFRAWYTAQKAKWYPGEGGTGSAGPYRSATPKLGRVLITWEGSEKYVDISAQLLKSPDCGIFKVDVDGKSLVQGVTMEIEIFKDVRVQGGVKERLTSAMTAEVEPRNNAK